MTEPVARLTTVCIDCALAVGARLADPQPQDGVRVMLDPAGHPFCLFVD